MNTRAVLGSIKSVVTNHYVSSLLIFGLWIVGLLSASVPVMLLGLVAYLRPLLYVRLLTKDSQDVATAEAEKAGKPAARFGLPTLAHSA